MTTTSLIRRHLLVELADRDETFEVATNVRDNRIYATTAKKHGWLPQQEDSVGYTSFVAWAAARRTGKIEAALAYEAWEELVVDISLIEDEVVTPTEPVPGTGSSAS
jgi:hypothetical protein